MAKSNETVYPLKEFTENPDIMGTTADIISAAFLVNGVKEATESEARKLIKAFKERKVQS